MRILFLSVLITGLSAACGEQEIALREEAAASADTTCETAAIDQEDMPAAEADALENTVVRVYVYVCGEVNTPGVYEVSADARVYEAVELAGGLTGDADPSVINQAERVQDGMMIRIPAMGEAAAAGVTEGTVAAADGTTLVDINKADAATLMTLPGIGASKAAAIISYRQENGGFASTQELKNVSGIGDSTYSKLQTQITVTP